MKKTIKITEEKLRNLIRESIHNILMESEPDDYYEEYKMDLHQHETPPSSVYVEMIDALDKFLYKLNLDDESIEEITETLTNAIPEVEVEVDSDYSDPEYEVGWAGGSQIVDVEISKKDKNRLYRFVQDGTFKKTFIDALIKEIENIGYDEASDCDKW